MAMKIHEVKPDWAMFSGADGFYIHQDCKNLRETIEWLDRESFTAVNDCFNTFVFVYTGSEQKGIDPRLNYMFYVKRSGIHQRCIAKYFPGMSISGDAFRTIGANRIYERNDLVFLHYTLRSDGRERKVEQYARRKKAWDTGMVSKKWGHHYRDFIVKNKFVYNKDKLLDIRNSDLWGQIKSSVLNG